MKYHLLVAVIGLSLTACQRADEENKVAPATIASDFNQDFSLDYRQQATLPSASQPELTVEVADLYYRFCPKNANCFTADYVHPTLSVTDAQGQSQEVKLPTNQSRTYNVNWLDTTSVRANGQRYVFYYVKYNLETKDDQPEKKDITVTLRISKSTKE